MGMILTVRDGTELDKFDLVLFVTLRKVADGIEAGTL